MKYRRIFNIQLLVNLIWTILGLLDSISSHKQIRIYVYIVSLVVLVTIIVGSNIKENLSDRIALILSVTILPFLLLLQCGLFFSKLCEVLPNYKMFFQIIYAAMILVVLIPNILQNYGRINNWLLRLMSVIFIDQGMIFCGGMNPQSNSFMTTIIESGIELAFAMLVVSYFLTKIWNIKYKINFMPKKSKNFQVGILLILIIFSTWYILIYTFRDTIDAPLEAFWKFDFNVLDPSQSTRGWSALRVVLEALYAGILEETMRYLNLTIILKGIKGHFRLEWAILISSAVFALLHYGNIITGDQSIVATNYQVAGAFGFGGMMAVLYLYTGQIWLPIFLHFLNDYIIFAHTPLSVGTTGNFYGYGISPQILEISMIAISVLFTIFMLFGKRRKFMEENANILVEKIA